MSVARLQLTLTFFAGSTCIIDLNHAGKDSMKRWLGVSVSSQVGNNSGGPQRGRRMSVGSSSSSNSSYSSAAVSYTSTNRKGGGRRKEDRDNEDGPPEEVVKRRMRRERNKLAAARCRKRRLDHTMALQQETEHWEEKKQNMQNEIRQLQKEKEELEMLLDAHRSQCKIRKISHPSTTSSAGHFASKIIPDLCPIIKRPQPQQVVAVDMTFLQKPQKFKKKCIILIFCFLQVTVKEEHQESEDSYLSDESQLDSYDSSHLPANMFSQVGQQNKIEFTKPAPRPRPTSLPVASPFSQHMARSSTTGVSEIAGIAITTPSSGIPGFNFDSLMEGGTGLTPVVPSPSCSTQQRSSALPVDLSSPEAVNRKLVSL